MAQPCHAGGAIPTFSLSSPSSSSSSSNHGLTTLMHTAATACIPQLAHHLDLTRLGSLIAIAGVLPAAWRFLHHAWRETYAWIRQFFLASVTIPGRDPLNRAVVHYVLAHVIEPRKTTRAFTARTEAGSSSGMASDAAAAAAAGGLTRKKAKSQRTVQYLPHFETVWFWRGRRLFVLQRSMESFSASMCDPGYEGVGGEELTISCVGRSVEPIRELIEACREYADRQTQYFVVVYSRDRYGISWQPKSRKPIRLLETVHFDQDDKRALLADIQKYLDPETQRRYQSRSMPYRRGYLFYGPPGTGKSSLSTALAGEFGLDLYEVKIPSVGSDADLEQMFQEIPPQCIVLLEDIDAVWTSDRDLPDREDRTVGSSGSRSPSSNCTLSGLLNVLDGVGSQEGRIVIMTTNKPERLDEALVRPGRVDMRVHLGHITQASARDMFLRMFSVDIRVHTTAGTGNHDDDDDISSADLDRMAHDFARHIPEHSLTPSQLQGFFQLHLDSPHDAAANVASWVEKEVARSSNLDEDLEIVGAAKA